MILGYHLILSTYGFWLPNDPRGSWSDFVRNYELYAFGPATKVNTRRSVANKQHNQTNRLAAKSKLKYKPVKLTGKQARAIAQGFAFRVNHSRIKVFACAVMPDHVHLVVDRGNYPTEQMINQLKGAATRQLLKEFIHPFASHRSDNGHLPSIWASGGWKVYLNSDTDMLRAIKYVQDNPIKAKLQQQKWRFTVKYKQTI